MLYEVITRAYRPHREAAGSFSVVTPDDPWLFADAHAPDRHGDGGSGCVV